MDTTEKGNDEGDRKKDDGDDVSIAGLPPGRKRAPPKSGGPSNS